MPPVEERPLWAVGAVRDRPPAPSRAEIVGTLRELSKTSDALIAVFDAAAIAGDRHLLSAWAHLGRARSRSGARLRDRAAEFALYVAGDDQLPRALAKVGVAEETQQFVVVGERARDRGTTLAAFGLREEAAAYPQPVTERTLERLGIGAAERSAVPAAHWEGLVLERVALVDLSGGGRASPPPKRK